MGGFTAILFDKHIYRISLFGEAGAMARAWITDSLVYDDGPAKGVLFCQVPDLFGNVDSPVR